MGYEWHDFVGNVGVMLVLAMYLLLQLGRLDPRTLKYSLFNALGAGLILVSLAIDFNMSAFAIEAAWLLISIVGVFMHFRVRYSEQSGIG